MTKSLAGCLERGGRMVQAGWDCQKQPKWLPHLQGLITGNLKPHRVYPVELIKLGLGFPTCDKGHCVPPGTRRGDLGRLERKGTRTRKRFSKRGPMGLGRWRLFRFTSSWRIKTPWIKDDARAGKEGHTEGGGAEIGGVLWLGVSVVLFVWFFALN